MGEGVGSLSGQTEMKPIATAFVTARFMDTAWAVTGTPQCPAIWKVRNVPPTSEGGPYGPLKPLPTRVSAKRQGWIAMNAEGSVGIAACKASSTGSGAACSWAVTPEA